MPNNNLEGRRFMSLAAVAVLACVGVAACAKLEGGTDSTKDGGAGAGGSSAPKDPGIVFGPLQPAAGGQSGTGKPPLKWSYIEADKEHAWKAPELPQNVAERFRGSIEANDGARPRIVYPLEGSLHPINFADLTVQWERGSSSNSVFRIDVTTSDRAYRFFVPCTEAHCKYALPSDEWLDVAAREAGQQMALTISGTDGSGGKIAVARPVSLAFSPAAVVGGLYYWSTALKGFKRAAAGSRKAVPFIVPNSDTNDYACGGCHSVSRDGKVIAFAAAADSEGWFAIQTAPTDAPEQPYVRPAKGNESSPERPVQPDGETAALNPDGSRMLVNVGSKLELRETRTNRVLDTAEAGDARFAPFRLAIHAEWSPDGQSAAVALTQRGDEGANCEWSFWTCTGTIGVLPIVGDRIGSAKVIVSPATDGAYHYYPTWSPDGRWLAFMTAPPRQGNETSNSNPRGVIRMTRIADAPATCPGPACHELTRGTQYSYAQALANQAKAASMPKFSPFALTSSAGGRGALMFITYSSRQEYGFLKSGQNQLWMFAVDVDRIARGEDGSSAPVWIPVQDLTDSSLAPYWTETIGCEIKPDRTCSGCTGGELCSINPTTKKCECVVNNVE
jgi:hypothetical protein